MDNNYTTPEVTPEVTPDVDETAKGEHEFDAPDIAVIDDSVDGNNTMSWMLNLPLPVGTRLYTAPPKREWVGLTDADIAQTMHGSVEGSNMLPYQFARAIEAKLKEKNVPQP